MTLLSSLIRAMTPNRKSTSKASSSGSRQQTTTTTSHNHTDGNDDDEKDPKKKNHHPTTNNNNKDDVMTIPELWKLLDQELRVNMGTSVKCGICLSTMVRPIRTPCVHAFCQDCLSAWLMQTKSCPECQTPIKSKRSLQPFEYLQDLADTYKALLQDFGMTPTVYDPDFTTLTQKVIDTSNSSCTPFQCWDRLQVAHVWQTTPHAIPPNDMQREENRRVVQANYQACQSHDPCLFLSSKEHDDEDEDEDEDDDEDDEAVDTNPSSGPPAAAATAAPSLLLDTTQDVLLQDQAREQEWANAAMLSMMEHQQEEEQAEKQEDSQPSTASSSSSNSQTRRRRVSFEPEATTTTTPTTTSKASMIRKKSATITAKNSDVSTTTTAASGTATSKSKAPPSEAASCPTLAATKPLALTPPAAVLEEEESKKPNHNATLPLLFSQEQEEHFFTASPLPESQSQSQSQLPLLPEPRAIPFVAMESPIGKPPSTMIPTTTTTTTTTTTPSTTTTVPPSSSNSHYKNLTNDRKPKERMAWPSNSSSSSPPEASSAAATTYPPAGPPPLLSTTTPRDTTATTEQEDGIGDNNDHNNNNDNDTTRNQPNMKEESTTPRCQNTTTAITRTMTTTTTTALDLAAKENHHHHHEENPPNVTTSTIGTPKNDNDSDNHHQHDNDVTGMVEDSFGALHYHRQLTQIEGEEDEDDEEHDDGDHDHDHDDYHHHHDLDPSEEPTTDQESKEVLVPPLDPSGIRGLADNNDNGDNNNQALTDDTEDKTQEIMMESPDKTQEMLDDEEQQQHQTNPPPAVVVVVNPLPTTTSTTTTRNGRTSKTNPKATASIPSRRSHRKSKNGMDDENKVSDTDLDIDKSPSQVIQKRDHHEDNDHNDEQVELQEEQAPFHVGAIVKVQSRTWPGVNKPGGVARITHCNADGTYHVAYILGGKETNVDSAFVQWDNVVGNKQQQQPRKRRQQGETELSMSLLQALAAQGYDTTGATTLLPNTSSANNKTQKIKKEKPPAPKRKGATSSAAMAMAEESENNDNVDALNNTTNQGQTTRAAKQKKKPQLKDISNRKRSRSVTDLPPMAPPTKAQGAATKKRSKGTSSSETISTPATNQEISSVATGPSIASKPRKRKSKESAMTVTATSPPKESNASTTSTENPSKKKKAKTYSRRARKSETDAVTSPQSVAEYPESGTTRAKQHMQSSQAFGAPLLPPEISNDPVKLSELADARYQAVFEAAVMEKTLHIVASNLNDKDVSILRALCTKTLAQDVKLKLSDTFSKKTSLCIMPLDPDSNKTSHNVIAHLRTAKAMRSALAGIPIVSPSWIASCGEKNEALLPPGQLVARSLPTKTEFVDQSGDANFGVARLAASYQHENTSGTNQRQTILHGYFVFLCGNFSPNKRTDIQGLAKEAGAKVLSSADAAKTKVGTTVMSKQHRVLLICHETASGAVIPSPLFKETRASLKENINSVLIVNPNWLFDSITCAKPLPVSSPSFAPLHPKAKELWKLSCNNNSTS